MAGEMEMINNASQISQALDPVMDIGGKALRNRRERKNEQKRWERNRKAALDDFNLQNEYNHPKNQMARLLEAGMNPNLAYGDLSNMGASPITQEATPKAEVEHFDSHLGQSGQNLMALEMMRMQKMAIQSNIGLNDAQIVKILTDVDKLKLDTQFKKDAYEDLLEGVKLRNVEMGSNIELKGQQREESESREQFNYQKIRESKQQIQKIFADTMFTVHEDQRKQLMSALERKKVDLDTKKLVYDILQSKEKVISEMLKHETDIYKQNQLKEQINMLQKNLEYFDENQVRAWLPFLVDQNTK